MESTLQLDNYLVVLTYNKPHIDSQMWYDDETERPESSFENFLNYNLRHNSPKRFLKNKREIEKIGLLKFLDGSDRYSWGLDDRSYGNKNFIYLAEEQEQKLVEAIENEEKKYIVRLERYFKRYGDKIRTSGYYANR